MIVHSIILFILLISFSQCRLPDKVYCVNEDCSEPISTAKTLLAYTSGDPDVMSFRGNAEAIVFMKSTETSSDALWYVRINGKNGFVNKRFLRENKLLAKAEIIKPFEIRKSSAKAPKVQPDKVQQAHEVIEGTTIYTTEATPEYVSTTESTPIDSPTPSIDNILNLNNENQPNNEENNAKESSETPNIIPQSEQDEKISDVPNVVPNSNADESAIPSESGEVQVETNVDTESESSQLPTTLLETQLPIQNPESVVSDIVNIPEVVNFIKNSISQPSENESNLSATHDANTEAAPVETPSNNENSPDNIQTQPERVENSHNSNSGQEPDLSNAGISKAGKDIKSAKANGNSIENSQPIENVASKPVQTQTEKDNINSEIQQNAEEKAPVNINPGNLQNSEEKPSETLFPPVIDITTETIPAFMPNIPQEPVTITQPDIQNDFLPITEVPLLSNLPSYQEQNPTQPPLNVPQYQVPTSTELPPLNQDQKALPSYQEQNPTQPPFNVPQYQVQVPTSTELPPLNQDQKPLPSYQEQNPSQPPLNVPQYPVPTSTELPALNQDQKPSYQEQNPTQPPLNVPQYQVPLPSLNQDQKPLPSYEEQNPTQPPLNVPQYQVPLPSLNQDQKPLPSYEEQNPTQPPLNVPQYQVPTSTELPSLNQDQKPLPSYEEQNPTQPPLNDLQNQEATTTKLPPSYQDQKPNESPPLNYDEKPTEVPLNQEQYKPTTDTLPPIFSNEANSQGYSTPNIHEPSTESSYQDTSDNSYTTETPDTYTSTESNDISTEETKDNSGFLSNIYSTVADIWPSSTEKPPSLYNTDVNPAFDAEKADGKSFSFMSYIKTAYYSVMGVNDDDIRALFPSHGETCYTDGFCDGKGNEHGNRFLTFLVTAATSVLLFTLGYYYIDNWRQDSKLICTINSLQRDLLFTTKECEILKEELSTTKTKLSGIEDSSFGMDDMVQSLKEEIEEMKAQNERLRNSLDDNEKLLRVSENTAGELQNTLGEVENTLSELLAERANSEEQITELNGKIQAFEEELISVSRDRDNFQLKFVSAEATLEESKKYKKQLDEINQQLNEARNTIELQRHEIIALKEAIKDIKGGTGSNVDTNSLIDHTEIKAKLSKALEEKKVLAGKYEIEQTERKRLSEELHTIQENLKTTSQQATEATTRLEVLGKYFQERESELLKELSAKESLWLSKQGESASTVEKIELLQQEVQRYKEKCDALTLELAEQESSRRSAIGEVENRAHNAWLSARAARREADAARDEAATLRRKLASLSTADGAVSPHHKVSSPLEVTDGGMIPPPLPPLAFLPPPLLPPLPRPPPLGRLPSPHPPRYSERRYSPDSRYSPSSRYSPESRYSPDTVRYSPDSQYSPRTRRSPYSPKRRDRYNEGRSSRTRNGPADTETEYNSDSPSREPRRRSRYSRHSGPSSESECSSDTDK